MFISTLKEMKIDEIVGIMCSLINRKLFEMVAKSTPERLTAHNVRTDQKIES